MGKKKTKNSPKTINQWPEHERPREKLLQRGPSALSDAELLAIFIRTGVPGKTAVDVARDLIDRYGSLRELLAAAPEDLCETPGLGEAKYVQLQASLEMGRRFLAEKLKREITLGSTRETREFLQAQLRDRKNEVFCVLFLDNRHRVLVFEELFQGTLNGTAVYPREIVKRALKHNAAAVILVHNHPSGVAEPSRADELLTDRLKEALTLVDIRLLDHLVVGDGETVSFSERGLI
ncbi:MAG: DNA repair protein RadC [Sulfuricaulis sp.]|uniref:RadC family protein n=1 Tax=Sulfuricaulis sp. TaxID=2003553 RepID=UPI0025D11447|nr:DNA repair protein RadC [Sulfuricaulis sp.]MCR4347618.1 DNA repair protein RadC [Sulfuricaulis sp.]